MASIFRIETKHTKGWQVRISLKENKYETHFFADVKHGGKDKAEQLAQACMNKYSSPFDDLPLYMGRPKNNKSGVTGVHRSFFRSKGSASLSPYWVATIRGPKNQPLYHKRFFVNKYGESTAYAMAVAYRLAWVEHLKENNLAGFWNEWVAEKSWENEYSQYLKLYDENILSEAAQKNAC